VGTASLNIALCITPDVNNAAISACQRSLLPQQALRQNPRRTRVTWTSSVFQMKQGTADRVTEIPTEFRRLNAVPIRDLRTDEGKYTAVANCIVTRGRFLSRYGQPWPWSHRFPELLVWVYAYLISEGDLFREVYSPKAVFGYGK